MTTKTINFKLVESLLQAIAALSVEEQHIVRSRLIPNGTPIHKRSVLDILAEADQLPAYRTPEEIDRDIQEERNSWDN
jgi:hypothetical protein